MKIFAHTCFIGLTGYANHARSFFTALNKYHEVKVRNITIGNTWAGYNNRPHDNESYLTDEMKSMLYQQTLYNNDGSRTDYPINSYDANFKPDVHIILMETDHHYFYDDYDGYKIAFNVWESTRYPDHFFKRLHYFDEVWVPTQWQFDCLVEQGYPAYKIFIIPEGVDVETFKPINEIPKKDKFRFLLFGRWDYRKATTEILKTFGETFKGMEDKVEMLCSIENPFPFDGLNSTQERLDHHNIHYSNLVYLNFPSRNDYIKYLQEGDVFVSAARSEGWNLPLIEAMACGTPSLYTNWGGQLQFAEGKGVPVKIAGLLPANIERKDFPGEYCEPDFASLSEELMNAYNNYTHFKQKALEEAEIIHRDFNWDNIAKLTCDILKRNEKEFLFVTTGDIGYMPVIEKLVQSLLEFSNSKIIVYGVDCEVPFSYPNMIAKIIRPPKHSIHDKWYWKQNACIESLNEEYDNFVWIDGDVVVNHNIDNIKEYFNQIENYPLSDIHIQEEFFGFYNTTDNKGNVVSKSQLFNEELCKEWKINKQGVYMHVCMYVYNKNCGWWFNEIIDAYMSIQLKDYGRLFLWNDEGIDNALRWKHGFTKHLPLSNFDTSGYNGYDNTSEILDNFYKYWNEEGPQNFNKIYGYQFIPKDKSKIIYFHGNKNSEISDKMIEFIKLEKDKSFYNSEYFYTSVYDLKNLGSINGVEGSTMEVASIFGWDYAIYHEIYNLLDYYQFRQRRIHDGDVVVDLGGNIGIFNRWAYSQGASRVISFEPDRRYFKLLKLNTDSRSVLFNAAMSNSIGEMDLHESDHLGGSTMIYNPNCRVKYKVRTYTLDYLFETGLVDHIDFLKVDIEGSEMKVFEGISDENLYKINAIGMEYHHEHLGYDENLRTNFIKRLNKVGFNSHILFLGNTNQLQMIYFSR